MNLFTLKKPKTLSLAKQVATDVLINSVLTGGTVVADTMIAGKMHSGRNGI